jgi:hypothetical protein
MFPPSARRQTGAGWRQANAAGVESIKLFSLRGASARVRHAVRLSGLRGF